MKNPWGKRTHRVCLQLNTDLVTSYEDIWNLKNVNSLFGWRKKESKKPWSWSHRRPCYWTTTNCEHFYAFTNNFSFTIRAKKTKIDICNEFCVNGRRILSELDCEWTLGSFLLLSKTPGTIESQMIFVCQSHMMNHKTFICNVYG
jgi:hypothetical protein